MSSVLDPQVTELTSDKVETRASPPKAALKNQDAHISVEQSAQAKENVQTKVSEENENTDKEKALVPPPIQAEAVLIENIEKAEVPPEHVQMTATMNAPQNNAKTGAPEEVPSTQPQPQHSDQHIGSVVYGEE